MNKTILTENAWMRLQDGKIVFLSHMESMVALKDDSNNQH
jgi:hypothetical protein